MQEFFRGAEPPKMIKSFNKGAPPPTPPSPLEITPALQGHNDIKELHV